MSVKYGFIAEDVSDIEVIKLLAKKIAGKNISGSHFVGKGCGPIKRKALGWCRAFHTKGCSQILLVHDRDKNDAEGLKRQLGEILSAAPQAKKVVVVPSEELEAWLLSDQAAIKSALKMKKAIKEEHHPEKISSPKEYLQEAVWKASGKTYINSIHNPLIAQHIEVEKIRKKCPSFAPFSEFFSS